MMNITGPTHLLNWDNLQIQWLPTAVFSTLMISNVRLWFSACQHLLPRPLLSGLRLHLLHLQRVQPPPAHKQVMVADAQLEDLHRPQTNMAAVSFSSPAAFHPVARLALTSLLTLCREELNLKTFAFLSSGLMVN